MATAATGAIGGRRSADEEDLVGYGTAAAASTIAESSSLQKLQKSSSIISLMLSPIAIILVSVWAAELGGVSWKEGESSKVFNWHPILMICAFSLMNVATLVFRITDTSSYQTRLDTNSTSSAEHKSKKRVAKTIHGSVWSISFILGIVAMMAVVKSHNDAISGYIANLYSLHSWVGVLVMTLYTLQLMVGLLSFGGFRNRLTNSPAILEIHKFSGSLLHILITVTILLGLQEKEGFISCSYSVDSADTMPFLHLGDIPSSCKISHGLGIVVLLIGILTSFSLARFPRI
ncbi:hypothetical protein THAOC_32677 [Thalassiosira oceanica]|uniref:Cytochrome b561 domain-containing protein n=1 Tax=Thalassiosira oceanica TaxID=159749 RepID=K0R6M0_THAOC|nr:hypothetical protein THAOC_32677 [Thalassiosira oceanica]|mmetsp:Transcript_20632/g.46655  ORF Transcript_20632/g.46655 Transcript_20632/m.46655 type:complete len:289 (-) Transcript_20632:52-918(-)|eukprot:EJK48515.1 hypothetical protein THAOC_32677 [Thalassiosira oceanica]